MLYHIHTIWNFTIKVALAKTSTCLSIHSTLILVTPSWHNKWWNICKKKASVGPSKNGDRKQKEREIKAIAKLLALHANAKYPFRNKQYSPYYVKVPQKPLLWTSIKNKMPNYTILFSGTSHGGDSYGVPFRTSNISLHLTVTRSRLKNVLKAHFQVWDSFWQMNSL